MRMLQLSVGDSSIYNGYHHFVGNRDFNSENEIFGNDFYSIPDNSCDKIIAFDFLSRFESEKIDMLMKTIVSKLRLGGEFSFDFLNFAAIDVINIEAKDFNNIVFRCKSAFRLSDFVALLDKYRLKIITTETQQDIGKTTVTVERV